MQSISHANQHLDRLHHHRRIVRLARAGVTEAAGQAAAAAYAQKAGTGPETTGLPPAQQVVTQAPPPSE